MAKDYFWKNQYSPSSFNTPAINMHVWRGNIQCQNGYYDKILLEQKNRLSKFKCKICGRTFWAEEFKMPKSIKR